jgi:hypothetical protein
VQRREQRQRADLPSDAAANHPDSSLLLLIRHPVAEDAEEAGHDVRRHGHELRVVVRVAQSPDDGRQEQGHRVDTSVDTEGDEHVHPDLPVFERLPHVLHVELVSQVRAVLLQAADDLDALVGLEELGGVGVILHDPECRDGCVTLASHSDVPD